MIEDPSYRLLMDYAMRALSRRAHTEFELREKLKKRPHHTTEFEDQILSRLIELNLINDDAFLDRQIEMASQVRFQGPFKLAERLRAKGITLGQVKDRWKEMELNEREIALEALKKIESKLSNLPRENRYQIRAQFLSNRGFSAEIIFDLAKSDDPM